jgi:hypothetical protein
VASLVAAVVAAASVKRATMNMVVHAYDFFSSELLVDHQRLRAITPLFWRRWARWSPC